MANSKQREREIARARYERQQAKRAQQARRRSIINRSIAAGVALVAILALVVLAVSQSGDDDLDPAASDPSPSPSVSDDAALPAECAPAPEIAPATLSWPAPPEDRINPDGDYTISLATNCGDIVIKPDAKNAPVTTNSMIFLANEKYFDNTPCHRLTTEGIFVLQCGDPTGTGSGGPGYQIADENLPTAEGVNYPAGTVAMANSGPGTNGSQFFLVYEDTTLGPNYTVWGQITEGLDVVQAIAEAGVEGGGGDGKPVAPVTILTATTSETLPVG